MNKQFFNLTGNIRLRILRPMERKDRMTLSRRGFLTTGVVGLPAIALARTVSATSELGRVVVILNGVGRDTPASLLEKAVAAFISRGVPISCVVDFSASGEDERSGDDGAIRAALALMSREPGLFQIVAEYLTPAHDQRYFQMRAAADLRAAIARLSVPGINPDIQARIVSVQPVESEHPIDISALRSAGFRVVVSPGDDGTGLEVEFVGREQMIVRGGQMLDLASGGHADLELMAMRLEATGDLLVNLHLSANASEAEDVVQSRAGEVADLIADAIASGQVFATRPVDLLLQSGPYPAPALGVALVGFQPDNAATAMQVLDGLGIPHSLVDTSPGIPASLVEGDGEKQPCIVTGNLRDLGDDVPARFVLLEPGIEGAFSGIRPDGRIQLALQGGETPTLDDLLPLNPVQDRVIQITPGDFETYSQRSTLTGRLLRLRQEGRARLYSITGFVAHVVVSDPVHDRFLSHLIRREKSRSRALPLTTYLPEALKEDAVLAWSYIDQFTHERTGLCAGTVRGAPPERINHEVTLWDIASQLRGIEAARDLSLIGNGEARDRTATLLDNLPVRTIGGLDLPPARFLSSSPDRSVDEYDICDVGRFLGALHAARDGGLISPDHAAGVFKRWRIADTVRDGHPFKFSAGRWLDNFQSHCSPYLRKCLRDWGIQIAPFYAPQSDLSPADRRMDVLYRAASVGPFGTEPGMLEALETGLSDATRYLTDVLFDAQLGYYEQSGKLKCASETPMDIAPWFSYQGLRFDLSGPEAWRVSTIDQSAEFQTRAFRQQAEVISSKAAYLWAASYPHPHSARLVSYIREKARVPGLGFSVGIYAATLTPMAEYSDLNTNGIILSAIAGLLSRQR